MAAYRVGVEISGNRVSMAMVDGQGTVLCRRVFSGHAMGAEQIVETLCDHLEDLLLKRGLQPTDVERIGIGVCGCADETRGVVRSAPALLHVRDVPLAQLVEGRIGVAPSIFEDGWAAAYAEHRFGCARDRENLLCVLLNRELGLGAMVAGKVLRTVPCRLAMAEEFNRRDTEKPCGSQQCLPPELGGAALLAAARERFGKRLPGERPSVRDVFALAQQGDADAVALLDQGMERLAGGLANALRVTAASTVVLAGAYMEYGKLFRDLLTQRLLANRDHEGATEIRLAGLGVDSVMVGAAFLENDDLVEPETAVSGAQ